MMDRIRRFARSPSRVRANAVLGGLVVTLILVYALTGSAAVIAVWAAVIAATGLLLLHDGAGAVANVASILAGRPIALTARGRELVDLGAIGEQTRQQFRVLFAGAVGLAVLGIVLALVSS